MSRKDSNKKMGKSSYKDDKLIKKLLIEFGIEKPKQNKKYNTANNKKGKGDK